jgi:hypothetical protein
VLTAEEGRRAKGAARQLLVDRLSTIARTARLMAKHAPGADAVFQVPADSSDLALLTAARAAITACEAALDRFVLLGLPKTFVAELQELTDSFEQAVHGRRAGKTGRAAAQAGIRTAQVLGMDAIRTLDIVVTNTLKDDPVSLAVWKRDRVIQAKSKQEPRVSPTAAVGPTTRDADAIVRASHKETTSGAGTGGAPNLDPTPPAAPALPVPSTEEALPAVTHDAAERKAS